MTETGSFYPGRKWNEFVCLSDSPMNLPAFSAWISGHFVLFTFCLHHFSCRTEHTDPFWWSNFVPILGVNSCSRNVSHIRVAWPGDVKLSKGWWQGCNCQPTHTGDSDTHTQRSSIKVPNKLKTLHNIKRKHLHQSIDREKDLKKPFECSLNGITSLQRPTEEYIVFNRWINLLIW